MRVLTDLAAISLAGVFAFWLRFEHLAISREYQVALLLCLSLALAVFSRLGLYQASGADLIERLRRITLAWAIVISALIVIGFLLKISASFSRIWLGLFAITGWLALIIGRVLAAFVAGRMHRLGYRRRRVIVLGAGGWAGDVIQRLRQRPQLGLDVVCVLDHDPRRHGGTTAGVPVTGDYDLLPGEIARLDAHEVWICLPLRPALEQMERIDHILRHSTVTQRFVPRGDAVRFLHQPLTAVVGLPVFNLKTSPMHGVNRLIKAIEDRVLATVMLVLAAPAMLVIAVLIRSTSGPPVLFAQQRHGWDGKPILVYKFRTMSEHIEPPGKLTQAAPDDPRVTRLGRWLRRTSLDELPQLFNVVQGTMSIVGPRPHAVEHNVQYMEQIDFYMQRHKVKPGITGWAQVNGLRGQTQRIDEMRKRIEYDLYYIENWSLWFDIRIIVLTLIRGFVHPRAF